MTIETPPSLPLSDAHKRIIHQVLTSIFTPWPENTADLQQQVRSLQTAKKSDNHALFNLYLKNPRLMPSICECSATNLGKIRLHMLRVINKFIEKAAHHLNVSIKHLGWNLRDLIVATLNQHDHDVLVGQAPLPASEHETKSAICPLDPWQAEGLKLGLTLRQVQTPCFATLLTSMKTLAKRHGGQAIDYYEQLQALSVTQIRGLLLGLTLQQVNHGFNATLYNSMHALMNRQPSITPQIAYQQLQGLNQHCLKGVMLGLSPKQVKITHFSDITLHGIYSLIDNGYNIEDAYTLLAGLQPDNIADALQKALHDESQEPSSSDKTIGSRKNTGTDQDFHYVMALTGTQVEGLVFGLNSQQIHHRLYNAESLSLMRKLKQEQRLSSQQCYEQALSAIEASKDQDAMNNSQAPH